MTAYENSLCRDCEENCCKKFYIIFETVPGDDWLKWLSYHEGVSIVKMAGGHVQAWFDYPCTHLTPDGSCRIYNKRPRLCRRFTCPKQKPEEKRPPR